MFIGHFGVGFGAKAAAPRTSLGILFLAAQFVDLLWAFWIDRHRTAVAAPSGSGGVSAGGEP